MTRDATILLEQGIRVLLYQLLEEELGTPRWREARGLPRYRDLPQARAKMMAAAQEIPPMALVKAGMIAAKAQRDPDTVRYGT